MSRPSNQNQFRISQLQQSQHGPSPATTSDGKLNLQHYERPGLSHDEIAELAEVFSLFDKDNSGTIDLAELKFAINQMQKQTQSPLTTSKYTLIQQLLDTIKAQSLTFDTFLDLMTSKVNEHSSAEEYQRLFNLFDTDQSGYITVEDLKRVSRELGESTMSNVELQEMIDRGDTDQDGMISLDEFINIMTRKGLD